MGACTGSGVAWNCTAGSSIANVNAAVASSADGAVISMAAGSYVWGSSLSFSTAKSTTIRCATVRGCTVTMSGPLWQWNNWGTTNKLYRISGFVFNSVGAYFIWLYGTGSAAATMTQLRFDNNTLNAGSSSSDIITFGETTGVKTTIYGVVDHNIFHTSSGNSRWIVNYAQAGAGTWPVGRIGTASNLFIEDNTFDDQSMVNAGSAALDTDGGPHTWVIRHNTFTNARIEHHGYYWSFPGPASSEVYENSFEQTSGVVLDGTYSIKHQGSGEWIVFNNKVKPGSGKGSPIIFQNYRSFYDSANLCDGTRTEDGNRAPLATYRGYPCNRQPGRNAAHELRPMYFWNNRWSDNSTIAPVLSCGDQPGVPNHCALHIVENRDYYVGGVTTQTSPTSPFSGASGMGFGTLANRPTTCTTGSEAGGGVGYWATDTSTLYRCSAANTWVAHYKPYTYPHPLVSGSTPPKPDGGVPKPDGSSPDGGAPFKDSQVVTRDSVALVDRAVSRDAAGAGDGASPGDRPAVDSAVDGRGGQPSGGGNGCGCTVGKAGAGSASWLAVLLLLVALVIRAREAPRVKPRR